MARGIRRQNIFSDDVDDEIFLILLKSIAETYELKIYAYCLMSNHFHLLTGTGNIHIAEGMKRLLHDYAMSYNRRHGFSGHLFEGRYKSVLVKDDQYFLQAGRYIHLNPVKAGIVPLAEQYRWSSYRTILRMSDDGITDPVKTLSYFKDQDVRRYQSFVEDIGHKYMVEEERIHKEMEEDEIWLPW